MLNLKAESDGSAFFVSVATSAIFIFPADDALQKK